VGEFERAPHLFLHRIIAHAYASRACTGRGGIGSSRRRRVVAFGARPSATARPDGDTARGGPARARLASPAPHRQGGQVDFIEAMWAVVNWQDGARRYAAAKERGDSLLLTP
jgi:hypothetical protein